MAEPLANEVIKRIGQAAELYHRLVILAAPAGSGKTATLQEVHERTGAPLINVNLELSRPMLDLSERQRAVQLTVYLHCGFKHAAKARTEQQELRDVLRCLFQFYRILSL